MAQAVALLHESDDDRDGKLNIKEFLNLLRSEDALPGEAGDDEVPITIPGAPGAAVYSSKSSVESSSLARLVPS